LEEILKQVQDDGELRELGELREPLAILKAIFIVN
jgi:hypothetical protein